jgi:isoleucyl-tRNA synthetase
MLGANANFDDETLRTKLRRVVNPLWNSAKFFLIYGKQHDWRPNKSSKSTDVEDVLNKWILVRLHQTIKDISENLDSYLVPPAVQVVEDFVDDLSRWYVRRSRERIFEGDMESLSVLYTVLVDFSKAAAPVIPFITEKIYQELVVSIDSSVPESVHLCDFPEFDQEFINENEDLVANMASDRIVVSPSHAVRGSEGVPARQPLRSLASVNPIHYEEIIKDEVNVKEILQNVDLKEFEGNSDYVVDKADGVALSVKNIPEELQAEGNAREMIRKIQNLRKKNGLTVGEEIEVVYKDTEDNKKSVELFSDQIKRKVQARSLRPGKEFSIKKL